MLVINFQRTHDLDHEFGIKLISEGKKRINDLLLFLKHNLIVCHFLLSLPGSFDCHYLLLFPLFNINQPFFGSFYLLLDLFKPLSLSFGVILLFFFHRFFCSNLCFDHTEYILKLSEGFNL